MNGENFNIYLRFHHQSMDLTVVSGQLGLEPSRIWKAGDPRTTSKGRPLEGVRDESYWVLKVLAEPKAERYVSDALRELVTRFSPHREFFQKFRASGGKIEFYVAWNLDRNLGDDFVSNLLAALADLGVDLCLDLYPPNTNLIEEIG